MSDEQFHEFHLDGKQMVFLFMASTVMAVVIFLCGVMVGRGVRANKAGEPVEAVRVADDSAPIVEGGEANLAETPAPDGPEELTYPERLDSPTPPQERLRAPESRGKAAAPAIVEEPVPAAAKVDPPAAATVAPAPSDKYREPGGAGFAVQVMTVVKRSDAEAEAALLASKGYKPFFANSDKKPGFRVRVGKYKTKKEADTVRNKLRKVPKYRGAWVPND